MKITIIGQGGHSKVIQDIISSNKEYEIVAYLDDRYGDTTVVDNIYFGPISAAQKIISFFDNIKFIIAIGNNKVRKSIAQKLDLPDDYYTTLIHKTAVVSPSAKIGYGTVIMPNAVINADAQIRNHVIVNTSAVVEHDNKLNDFAHVSPGSTLTGSVEIGEGTHIGAGATVIPNVKIGQWSVIGAGAVVTHDIPSNCTAVGIPAKVIRK